MFVLFKFVFGFSVSINGKKRDKNKKGKDEK